jgi:hypothetical protein
MLIGVLEFYEEDLASDDDEKEKWLAESSCGVQKA